jgi:hypothetical protein
MEYFLTSLKEWGGLVLSTLGIIGSFSAYVHHDKKLKSQEAKLNELQIKQLEKEVANEKKAEMKANILHGHNGTARIRFVNAGKVDALNVRIEILSSEKEIGGIYHHTDFGPYDVINPQSYREEKMYLTEGCPDVIRLKIIWNDEFQRDNSVTLSVPF